MDNDRFFIFLGFIGIIVFLTEDSDDVCAGRGPRLRGDVRVWTFAVFSLLVDEGSSAMGSARLPLPARGVGAGVGGGCYYDAWRE